MSFFENLSMFLQSLFGGSSPEAKKKQELRKIDSELKELRPVIYKNDMIQPNFAEALRILYFNTKPIQDILSNTLCTDDIQRNNRYTEQLLLTGFPLEVQDTLESFVHENLLTQAIAADSLTVFFDKKHKELEAIIRQLNTPEFVKIDAAINKLRQLSDLCNYNFFSALRLFDVNFSALDSDYEPSFQPISPNLLETSLLDLFYIASDLEISNTMARATMSLYELYHNQRLTDNERNTIQGHLEKIQSVLKNIMKPSTLLNLIRMAKGDINYVPKKAQYNTNSRQKYAEYLQTRFYSSENRLKIEIKDNTINTEVKNLFADKPLLTLTGYNNAINKMLKDNSSFAFNWIIPMEIIKSFYTVFYADKVKALLNDIVIEGFFNNPSYKSEFSSAVYECNDAAERIETFEQYFARGGQFDEALITGLIRDSHKDSDFTLKLKELVDSANQEAKQLIQTETTVVYNLYNKLAEIIVDAKKSTSDTISNLKVLMTSSRNREGSSLLEQQFPSWKLFLEIMKNYAIIGSIENKA